MFSPWSRKSKRGQCPRLGIETAYETVRIFDLGSPRQPPSRRFQAQSNAEDILEMRTSSITRENGSTGINVQHKGSPMLRGRPSMWGRVARKLTCPELEPCSLRTRQRHRDKDLFVGLALERRDVRRNLSEVHEVEESHRLRQLRSRLLRSGRYALELLHDGHDVLEVRLSTDQR